ncbi:MAG: AgmX/PglI C-terminal domain-containing protein [Myxococcales bacterium]|nr:AgmX/PglI C-terminal domain-containing protein [Myxococcales bacterium]MCB9583581.1 AgmX/PglI C-terminal domain-containing protein [Polyangiaceae bacterium]
MMSVRRGTAPLAFALAVAACASPPRPVAPKPAPTPPPAKVAPVDESTTLPPWLVKALDGVRLPTADHGRPLGDGPNVLIDHRSVVVEGLLVADTLQLAADPRVQRVDGQFEVLKRLREEWVRAHPSEPFPGIVRFWIDAELPAYMVKSAFETAVMAGYPHGQLVVRQPHGDWAQLPVEAFVPGPSEHAIGRLAPELIQREMRSNYDTFRKCYEGGLAKDPKLEGRVVFRFVIDTDGSVQTATDKGSTISDANVVRCVLDAVSKITFPKPKGGIVTVIYPIQFSPEE